MSKHVMNNDQVAHAWFHEYKELGAGRSANGNIYFDGPTIYSYGPHFPIATIIELSKPMTSGKSRVVLHNPDRYSNTTSHHQATVRSAIDYHTAAVIMVPGLNSYESWRRIIEAALTEIDDAMLDLQQSMDTRQQCGNIHLSVLDIAAQIEILNDLLSMSTEDIGDKLRKKIAGLNSSFDIAEYTRYLQTRQANFIARYAKANAKARAKYVEKIGPIYEAHMRFWDSFRDKMYVWDDPDYLVSVLDDAIKKLPRIPPMPGKKERIFPLMLDDRGPDMLRSVAMLMVKSLLNEYENSGVMIYHLNPFYLVYKYLLGGNSPASIESNDTMLEQDILRIIQPIRRYVSEGVVNAYITSGRVMKASIDYDAILVFGINESNLLAGFGDKANAMIRLRQDDAESEPYIWTSMSVRMSLEEFKRYCKLLDAIEKHGLDVLPERLRKVSRMYQIHDFDGDVVTVGCHHIPWYNIRRVAREVCDAAEGV